MCRSNNILMSRVNYVGLIGLNIMELETKVLC